MKLNDRMSLAQKAAIDVINALTIGDHFGVILFSSSASSEEKYLLQATKANKEAMISKINAISPGGGTNFYEGFKSAYDLL